MIITGEYLLHVRSIRVRHIYPELEKGENGMEKVVIDVKQLYGETAKLEKLGDYVAIAKELAGDGNDVVLTGQGPIWLYLAVAHALHGKVRSLIYDSPVTGAVVIFDHNPFLYYSS